LVVLPFVIQDPVTELDYPDQIPALERAVLAWKNQLPNTDREVTCKRHPA
jgi:hypothetical protein